MSGTNGTVASADEDWANQIADDWIDFIAARALAEKNYTYAMAAADVVWTNSVSAAENTLIKAAADAAHTFNYAWAQARRERADDLVNATHTFISDYLPEYSTYHTAVTNDARDANQDVVAEITTLMNGVRTERHDLWTDRADANETFLNGAVTEDDPVIIAQTEVAVAQSLVAAAQRASLIASAPASDFEGSHPNDTSWFGAGWFSNVWDTASTFFDDTWDTVTDYATFTADWVSETADSVGYFVQSAFAGMLDFAGDLYEVGVQGLTYLSDNVTYAFNESMQMLAEWGWFQGGGAIGLNFNGSLGGIIPNAVIPYLGSGGYFSGGIQALWQPVTGDIEGFVYGGPAMVHGTPGPIGSVNGGFVVTTPFNPDWQYGEPYDGPTLASGYSEHFGGYNIGGGFGPFGGALSYDFGLNGPPHRPGTERTGIDALTVNLSANAWPGGSAGAEWTYYLTWSQAWDRLMSLLP